jgi:hypothetical protein
MLEVNNNFLLVGLIIVAVTCIYLLYLNLSKASELTSLKSALTSLIQQNKKRDEINNFLLERVDTLTAVINGQVNTLPAPPMNLNELNPMSMPTREHVIPAQEPVTEDFDSAEIDEILAEEPISSNQDPEPVTSELDTVLTPVPEPVTSELDTVLTPVPEPVTSELVPEPVTSELVPEPVTSELVPEPVTSELKQVVHCESLTELVNNSEFGDDVNFLFMAKQATANNDLVSGLLHDGDQSVNGDLVSELGELDTTIDYEAVPKDKKKLTSGYTAKQLKSIARHFGVKSRGTKTELVNRIYDKLT